MAESRKKPFNVDMAEQRITRLFSLAEKAFPKRPDLANRYVDIARRISMRHRVSIPANTKEMSAKNATPTSYRGKTAAQGWTAGT